MTFYEVFSHAELKRYKATYVSKATLVQIICIVLTFLSPFFIAYFSNGFWITEETYTEQPRIKFKHRFIALFETTNNFIVSSSFDNINDLYLSHYRGSLREAIEIDENGDGINDNLKWSLEIPIDISSENIVNAKILLLFNFTLTSKQNLQFESIGFIDASAVKASSSLTFAGSLKLRQNQKLRNSGYNIQYATSPLNSTTFNLEDLDLDKILTAYNSRPFGSKVDIDYATWKSTSNLNTFKVNALIRYPQQPVVFVPGFWQQIKWGWIQYLAVLIPFVFVFKLIKIFIFENQLVPTIVKSAHKIKEN